MATAVHAQSPLPRPSMDRTPSFDQPRPRSTPPFTHSQYDRPPSPAVRPPHSRSSSTASTSSPYAQPFNNVVPNSYFPPPNMYGVGIQPHTAWTNTALPANAFYSPHMPSYPGQVFQPGFQQSQADFAAWATAYHHMVAASMNNGNAQGMVPPQTEYMAEERRRTNSGPSSTGAHSNGGMTHSQSYQDFSQHSTHHVQQKNHAAQPQPYHPYKRETSRRPSHENVANNIPRSISQPVFPDTKSARPAPSGSASALPQDRHKRSLSLESSPPRTASVIPPPRVASRQDSVSSERERSGPSPAPSATPRAASPASTIQAVPVQPASTIKAVSQPLHTGPIANATNTPNPALSRPSPLSQAHTSSTAEPEKVKSGLKSRLRKVLEKDTTSTPKKQTPSPQKYQYTSKPTFASPSETSTRSATPPTTPPQGSNFPPPSAPFAVHHQAAMGSDISLAETERTTTAPSEMTGTGKSKRSLFRMKNMSTDNISLASTVSSASMMIRKMGSIGKLARRNSLMGISKIFKDKPKDEDASLPEKDGKKKKSKKGKSKSEAAPAAVSRATAEQDREPIVGLSEDENRVLAGLSPAAKLARQHTLRSRAEQAKKDAKNKTGEPTWDNNTATRQANGVLPSISSVTGADGSVLGPEVVHITPGRTSTIVHAVAVDENDYDSEDDSSDGETIEDVTVQMAKTRLSDGTADKEFRDTWGNAWIDKYAVPKKGILKNVVSLENLERAALRQRSSSTAEVPQVASIPGPLALPGVDANQIDGLVHPSASSPSANHENPQYDPFSPSFSPFDSPLQTPDLHSPYSNPPMNTSAPNLTLIHAGKPLTPRSMTVPARKRLIWAPECSVYSTYDAGTYDRRSEPATCNWITPEVAQAIKQELNALKMEMNIHPSSRIHTHYFS